MNPVPTIRTPCFLFLLVGLLCGCAPKQIQVDHSKGDSGILAFEVNTESFMMKMQDEALKETYRGVFTADGKQENLFPITSTGISTGPIIEAGQAFIKSLSKEQQKRTLFSVNDPEWRKWSNVDHEIFLREGISLKEMDQNQRKLAFQLMQQSLSAKGLQLSKDIMKTDHTLREINNNNPIYDEDLFFFTIMGSPSKTEPWGWQIDGHHLIINYFVLGDQVVMTPAFMGAEPVITTSGKYKGNTLFQDEQDLGLQFMRSLSSGQQELALLDSEKHHNDVRAEAFKDNVILDFEGLKASRMSEDQKAVLLHLADQYISNMRPGHSQIRLDEIKAHLEDTYFAWVGDTAEDAVFYYRIHSPVVLIEFDHQAPVGVSTDVPGASRNHIHTVVRTPNGNDYGKDLLRQHLETHH